MKIVKVGDFFFVKDTNHTMTVHVAKGRTVQLEVGRHRRTTT